MKCIFFYNEPLWDHPEDNGIKCFTGDCHLNCQKFQMAIVRGRSGKYGFGKPALRHQAEG